MRGTWNPTRRNRNIGTPKQGYGQHNEHNIPNQYRNGIHYFEQIQNPVVVTRQIHDQDMTFIVEPPRSDCHYACTIDDLAKMLALLPQDDVFGIKIILLRQPTRKQQIHRPVWGRLIYHALVGQHSGHAICLEAINTNIPMKWPLSLSPQDKTELDRLEQDGHKIIRKKRVYEIHCSTESTRITQLFRTLPHELGHYVDWRNHTVTPWELHIPPEEAEKIANQFYTKTHEDKEAFAHRYALEQMEMLKSKGEIPFQKVKNTEQIQVDGLNAAWFHYEGNPAKMAENRDESVDTRYRD